MTLRALVVDDEPLAREGLASDLAALGVTVVAVCANGREALHAIRTFGPDVAFLDIQMPEMDGFEMLEELEPEDTPAVVIFVTAYDQHAVRAFGVQAMDYLLKPVTTERLRESVTRAQQRLDEVRALRDASPASESAREAGALTQLIIRERDRTIVVPIDDIEWIEAETYYVRLHLRGAKPRLLRERMSVLEARLDPSQFVRTHRSAIVRRSLIREVRSASKYESLIVLSTGDLVPLSRERRAGLGLSARTSSSS